MLLCEKKLWQTHIKTVRGAQFSNKTLLYW